MPGIKILNSFRSNPKDDSETASISFDTNKLAYVPSFEFDGSWTSFAPGSALGPGTWRMRLYEAALADLSGTETRVALGHDGTNDYTISDFYIGIGKPVDVPSDRILYDSAPVHVTWDGGENSKLIDAPGIFSDWISLTFDGSSQDLLTSFVCNDNRLYYGEGNPANYYQKQRSGAWPLDPPLIDPDPSLVIYFEWTGGTWLVFVDTVEMR